MALIKRNLSRGWKRKKGDKYLNSKYKHGKEEKEFAMMKEKIFTKLK